MSDMDSTDANEAANAAIAGMLNIDSADAVEGMLSSQLIVANEASLSLYRRALSATRRLFRGKDEISATRVARWHACSIGQKTVFRQSSVVDTFLPRVRCASERKADNSPTAPVDTAAVVTVIVTST
jgi:hypothetical protein